MTDSLKDEDWPEWIPGETYTWEQIKDYTWGDRNVPPGTRFRYSKKPEEYYGAFDEVTDENPFSLVQAGAAQAAVLALLQRGLTLREVARQAGVSLQAAERAAAGHGHVRRATQDALVGLAANGNGKVRVR